MTRQISAIICTLNRANYLRKAIQSLVEQTLNPELYEIIVVDNCSTDNTKQIVTEEFASVTNLRYIYEPILGVSQARNTAWRNAKGQYMAYLDDDAIAYPNWLEKILEVFNTVTPQPGCIGGRIDPIWEALKPEWLPENLSRFYTIVDYFPTPRILNSKEYLVGANMAFPRELLEKCVQFPLNLDRKGKKLLSMGENRVQEILREKGYYCYYHPEIGVQHHVSAARLTQDWLLRRLYWEGVGAAITQMNRESPSTLRRWRMGLSKIRRLIQSPQKLADLLLPTENPDRFESKCLALMQIGYVAGIVGMAK
jgi:glycosyltransferase involved in cell wall biosynthesis